MNTTESASPSWTRSVYSDSVLCLVKMNDDKGAVERWEGEAEKINMSASYKELKRFDEEPIEFEWNIFPGFTSLQILRIICKSGTLNLRNVQTGSSSCQCSTTLIGQEKKMMEICRSNSAKDKEYAKRFSQGHWTFFGPGDEKKWYGTPLYTPEGK